MVATIRLLLLIAVVLAVSPAGSALAVPKVDGIFDLAGVQTNGQLTVGPDGDVWVALEQAVGKVQPDGGSSVLATADLGNTIGSLTGGITSAGGFIWVSQAPGGGNEAIVKIPPANPGSASGVPVTGITAGATAMTTGPDGNVWVALPGKIVKFSPSNPLSATTYPVAGLAPKGMTAASDGTLWVTDTGNDGRLLNVTTAGAATPYTVGGQPQFVGAGPGGQVVYGNPNSSPQQIGRLLPGGLPLTVDRPSGSDPFGVTFGADGAYWIAEFAGNRLARLTTDGQLTTLGGLPVVAGRGPRQLTAGPGNTLWVTLDEPGNPAATKIARITGVDPPPPVQGGTAGGAPTGVTPPDTTPPAITAARLSKSSFTAGARSVSFRFTLSEPATAKLLLSRRVAGRRHGKACVKPTRRLRKARPCARLVRVRTISFTGKAGANAIPLGTKGLTAGSYSAALTVVDAAGNQAVPVTRTFTIIRKPQRR